MTNYPTRRQVNQSDYKQGCQLPDFSLRSQTFCYTADFSTTFLYMLQTKTFFAHPITKPPASTLEFNILTLFCKKICDSRQKLEKHLHPAGSSCVWVGLWSAVTRTLSTSRRFQTFLKHNVGNPDRRPPTKSTLA